MNDMMEKQIATTKEQRQRKQIKILRKEYSVLNKGRKYFKHIFNRSLTLRYKIFWYEKNFPTIEIISITKNDKIEKIESEILSIIKDYSQKIDLESFLIKEDSYKEFNNQINIFINKVGIISKEMNIESYEFFKEFLYEEFL